jgi:8-oxo-dGTP pyrophosphatase MutT (NUDIX family)
MARQFDVIVQAAGGVPWRERKQLELLVVHRPAYDDWTFPKGKRDRTDADLAVTARREVLEETGWNVVLGAELISIEYVDRKGRYKHARYWEMRALSGLFRPNREVDDARWVPFARVHEVLTYERDRQVLAAFHRWRSSATTTIEIAQTVG